ncbi:twin-arginine translocase TatA/TatE family subunit [Protofrankia symbiont of Coriaria ruscifolia]|uniref:twin-arginine translocase TatA/TatE family subunit n=1 Tax=Protofrankia symbiont of Coriaria ruscifolia TaxID=1306542 RepID=UPI001F5FEBB6|nr:twin-arginine translocase TatA/TatE family subunit [Protofrankia symbiont of Coriaria ruscifolia]
MAGLRACQADPLDEPEGHLRSLGAAEIGLIVLAVMLLFGYRKLPDASRSLGRSLRIFKSEVDGLRHETPVTSSSPAEDVAAPGPVPRALTLVD